MTASVSFLLSNESDSERMNFMFSAFPLDRNLNPKHWESKLLYWRNEVIRSCRFFDNFCISCNILRDRFIRNGKPPLGILIVFRDMVHSGELQELGHFSNLKEISWGHWSANILQSSMVWAWQKMWNSGSAFEDKVYIVKELVEEYAIVFLEKHYQSVKYEKTDNVVPWEVAKAVYKVNNKCMDDTALTVLTVFLKSKGKLKVGFSEDGKKILKFKTRNENVVTSFNDNDWQIINLKKTIAKLTLECKQMEDDVARLRYLAVDVLRKKNQSQAKKILAQKNQLVKASMTKQDILMRMKENLRIVQEAESTKMITDAFNSSATLLSHSYREQGLSVESVENTMARTAEANALVNDIGEALSSGIRNIEDDIDMDELEKELDELTVGSTGLSPSATAVFYPASATLSCSDILNSPLKINYAPPVGPEFVSTPKEDEMLGLDLPDVPTFSPFRARELRRMEGDILAAD